MVRPQQGDIYWVKFGRAGDSGPSGKRPAIVIQNDLLNISNRLPNGDQFQYFLIYSFQNITGQDDPFYLLKNSTGSIHISSYFPTPLRLLSLNKLFLNTSK